MISRRGVLHDECHNRGLKFTYALSVAFVADRKWLGSVCECLLRQIFPMGSPSWCQDRGDVYTVQTPLKIIRKKDAGYDWPCGGFGECNTSFTHIHPTLTSLP